MEDFSDIVNWNNFFKQSEEFKNKIPFKFGYIEDFFQKDFYDKLYESFPKIDETWEKTDSMHKTCYSKFFQNSGHGKSIEKGDDPLFSQAWNRLKRYAETEEWIENFKKFSDVPVNKLKALSTISMIQGGFQLPHFHNVGPSTLVIMLYFTKNWKKGEPGGTYIATEEDESTIIFEPYNLDNSIVIFQDGPKAIHGTRYIASDVVRNAFQMRLEGYDEKTRLWTGDN